MNHSEEFCSLVRLIIKAAKAEGKKITQKEIGRSIGITNESAMSQLMRGHETVNRDHILRLKDTYSMYMPKEEEVTRADIRALQSAFGVIVKEIAKLKKDFYKDINKGKESKDYLNELLEEVALSEVGKRVQHDQ